MEDGFFSATDEAIKELPGFSDFFGKGADSLVDNDGDRVQAILHQFRASVWPQRVDHR